MYVFSEEQIQKMNKIIEMTIGNSAICKECKHCNFCLFALDCLSDNYKKFQKKPLTNENECTIIEPQMKKQRDILRLILLDLLTQPSNKILETCEETEEEWGFIKCINDKGQEIKLVFKENPEEEKYVDVVDIYINGVLQIGIE